ncbi:MAG: hypothetical protein KF764_17325 [Labilithrix sp.]|nr:hypothetical protein [Labilithrix sp.]MBX3221855.1 hypothetical protein [Labilithrix sp.]
MPGKDPEGADGGARRRSGSASWPRVLSGLTALARQVGVEVRIEPFALAMAGKGGLCRIEGRRVILVDEKLGVVEQIAIVGEALGRVLPKSTPVPPDLVPYLRTGRRRVARLLRLRPLARGR